MQADGAPQIAYSVEVLEYATCKPSLQNGIQNTSVPFLPFFIFFFSPGAVNFCSTAQQLGCFHQQAFGQEVLFTAWSFLCLKIPLSEDSIGNLCKSHFSSYLKFISHNTFMLNEISWASSASCTWNIIYWWKKKATHQGKILPGTQAVDRQTNETWAKKYKSPLQQSSLNHPNWW